MRARYLLAVGLLSSCTVGDLPPHDAGAVDTRLVDTRTAEGSSDAAPWFPSDAGGDGPGPAVDLRLPSFDVSAPDVPVSGRDGAAGDLPADAKPAACSWWRGGRALSWSKVPDLPTTVSSLTKDTSGAFFAGGTGLGVYRSADRGLTWSPSATGLPAGSRIDVLVPCGAAGLCVSLGSGIYASVDGGAHWSKRADNPTASSGGLDQIFPSPSDPQTLFATGYDGLMRSDDSGEGWFGLGTGLPGAPAVIAVSPLDGNVVYAGTGSLGSNGQGVWRSTDRGQTFSSANRGMLDLAISALAVGPDGTVYAAGASSFISDTKLLRSDDGGASWVPLGVDFGYRSGALARVVVSRELDGAVFLLRNSLAVEVSCDRGATWSTLVPAAGSEASSFDAPALMLDVDGSGGLVLLAGAAASTSAGTVSGAYRAASTVDVPDGGAAPASDAGAPVDAASPADAAAPLCPFWKSGRVVSWKAIDTLPSSVTTLVVGPNGTDIFAAANSARVCRTSDQGATWSPAGTGLPTTQTPGLAVCGKELCAATGWDVYASGDGGAAWTKRASNPASITELFSVPADPTTLFGLGISDGLMRSDDSGAGWVSVGTGLGDGPSILAFSPGDPNLVYAGTGGGASTALGVWKSTDRGASFVAANKGMLDMEIRALLVTGDGTVFAGSPDKLLRSSNGGADWQDISARLAPVGSSAGLSRLAAGPGGAVFLMYTSGQTQVSCDGGNTWRSVVAATSVNVFSSQPALLAVGDPQRVILLAGFEEAAGTGGGKRAVLE